MNLPWEFEPIRTERLLLRRMTPDDLDDVYSYQSREDVARYQLNDPRTREEVVERLGQYVARSGFAQDDDWIQPAIELDGRVIGQVFLRLYSVEHQGVEVGWIVHPDHQGEGYATEAATALLDVAFTVIGVHRVRAEIDPENDASAALCRRLGMREEALLRKDQWVKGAWGDSGLWAILEEEWAARRDDGRGA